MTVLVFVFASGLVKMGLVVSAPAGALKGPCYGVGSSLRSGLPPQL